ncbi:MAG: nucleotide exchange factor GrpE [Oscillospiraceae bacterium]|nr:nucleotide exchange factor GrpE [Oscillospiraceae bacterium]
MSEEKEFTAEEIVDEVKEAAEEAAAEEAEAAVIAQDEKPEEKPEKKPSRREEKKRKKEDKEKDELITALESEKAALNDKFLRVCAEYDNFRRRSQKEKDALYGDIRANTVSQFLPVYDNLERALKQSTEDEAYRKGVEMIMAQFETTLEKIGVKEIPSLGETFNPELHNAVMHVEDEEKGENEIVEVFQKGFMLNDKVIRFAMVKVAN